MWCVRGELLLRSWRPSSVDRQGRIAGGGMCGRCGYGTEKDPLTAAASLSATRRQFERPARSCWRRERIGEKIGWCHGVTCTFRIYMDDAWNMYVVRQHALPCELLLHITWWNPRPNLLIVRGVSETEQRALLFWKHVTRLSQKIGSTSKKWRTRRDPWLKNLPVLTRGLHMSPIYLPTTNRTGILLHGLPYPCYSRITQRGPYWYPPPRSNHMVQGGDLYTWYIHTSKYIHTYVHIHKWNPIFCVSRFYSKYSKYCPWDRWCK